MVVNLWEIEEYENLFGSWIKLVKEGLLACNVNKLFYSEASEDLHFLWIRKG